MSCHHRWWDRHGFFVWIVMGSIGTSRRADLRRLKYLGAGANQIRQITYVTVQFVAFALFTGVSQPTRAQQAGGVVFELPEIRNYVALAVGVVPDYLGSDDYTGGGAPAGLIKFGWIASRLLLRN